MNWKPETRSSARTREIENLRTGNRWLGAVLGLTLSLAIVGYFVADAMIDRAYDRGRASGYQSALDRQESLEEAMARMGLCKWAKIVLARPSCAKE